MEDTKRPEATLEDRIRDLETMSLSSDVLLKSIMNKVIENITLLDAILLYFKHSDSLDYEMFVKILEDVAQQKTEKRKATEAQITKLIEDLKAKEDIPKPVLFADRILES